MATNKPTKPSSTLPTAWGGTKLAFTEEQISNGYEANVEEVIDGGNLNYSLEGLFERVEYLTKVVDYIVGTPIGKSLIVDSNNRLDYETYAKPADLGFNIHYME